MARPEGFEPPTFGSKRNSLVPQFLEYVPIRQSFSGKCNGIVLVPDWASC